ncbi:MAG: MBL fold metallo-hydrolase [Methylobacteriaceae bacterium]|nr:MBL fold metallo-hydrolase [Methylobacteriaceae bacterium]
MAQRLELGRITIHRIVEQEAALFDALQFFPALTPEFIEENRSWLKPNYFDDDNKLILCIQSYLVITPHEVVLIDTCVGNHKPRPAGPGAAGLDEPVWDMMSSDRYERNLASTGLTVDDVDYVLCTHLHIDHVGWNTRLEDGRWVPTFPRAKYVFAERELQHWIAQHGKDSATCPWIGDSVLPIVEADQVELVKSDHALSEFVTLVPTPGHTIDHYSVRVGTRGEDAIVTGDMMHTPLQVRYPEIGMLGDFNSRQAEETRRAFFDHVSETSTLLCTSHFPAPSTCRIIRRGDGFDFVPKSD